MSILIVNQSRGQLFNDVLISLQKRTSTYVFSSIFYNRSTTFARLSTWLIYSIHLFFYIVFLGWKHNKLLVVSNPPLAPLVASFGYRPYSLLLYDLYPQVLDQIRQGHFAKRLLLRFFIRFWHILNRKCYSNAEYIFTLSTHMADQLRQYFISEDLWRQKVVVIPPWADANISQCSPSRVRSFRSEYNVKGLLITYSGNMGLTHPLEPLLDACSYLEQLKFSPQVQVLLIGNGPKRNSLMHYANSLMLSTNRLRFVDPLPYIQLPYSLSSSDLAVVALDNPASAASLPSKTFNALACGTPLLVISPVNSALGQLVLDFKCGYVVEPGPNAARRIAELMIYLSDNPEELTTLSTNALSVSNFFSPKNSERLSDIFLGLVNPI